MKRPHPSVKMTRPELESYLLRRGVPESKVLDLSTDDLRTLVHDQMNDEKEDKWRDF